MTHVMRANRLIFGLILGTAAGSGACTGGPQPAPPFDPRDGGISMDSGAGQSGFGGTSGSGGVGGAGGVGGSGATDGGDAGPPTNSCDLDAGLAGRDETTDGCVPIDATATD
jgi:hypothetical protein